MDTEDSATSAVRGISAPHRQLSIKSLTSARRMSRLWHVGFRVWGVGCRVLGQLFINSLTSAQRMSKNAEYPLAAAPAHSPLPPPPPPLPQLVRGVDTSTDPLIAQSAFLNRRLGDRPIIYPTTININSAIK